MTEREPKKERERPSLSILCSMYSAASDPEAMVHWYGTNGWDYCQAYTKACGELGNRIHSALELFELGAPGPFHDLKDPRELHMANLVADWIEQTGMKAVDCPFSENGKAIEVVLNSHMLDFTCRADRIVTFGNDPTLWVGDYKTSSKMSESYKLQLAGYALGWFERTGKWIDQGFILRVEKSPKKSPQIKAVAVYDLHRWVEPLILLRQLWDIQNRRGEWKDFA